MGCPALVHREAAPHLLRPVPWGLTTWRLGLGVAVGRLVGLVGGCRCGLGFSPGRVGEGRACWSLGNAYVSMGSPAQALTFAKKHLEISQEVSHASPALSPSHCLGGCSRPPGAAQPTPDRPAAFGCPGLFLTVPVSFPVCCYMLPWGGHLVADCYSQEVGVGEQGACFHP